MILSILIPSIPERLDKLGEKIIQFEWLFNGYDFEVLSLCDNRKMTIGEKRNTLKNICKGDYFAFLDDDDDVFDSYEELAFTAESATTDVITFKSEAVINGESSIIDMDLTHTENEQWRPNAVIKRPPWHVCAWRREKFQHIPFDFTNYGEDWTFCERALKIAKTQTKIDEVLHRYNFNSELSRAEN